MLFSTEADDLSWLAGVPGAERVERDGTHVAVHGSGPLLAYAGAALVERGLAPLDLRAERKTLEDAFLALTDDEPADIAT